MSTDIRTGHIPVNISSTSSSHKNLKAQQHNASTVAEQPTQTKSADVVSMTDQVSRLQQIESLLAAIPAVNDQLVAEISQSIADGSFEIDPGSVASKLIEMESGVLDTDNS